MEKTGALCWGQRYIWLRHHQLPPHARHEAHIVSTYDLPEGGVPVATVRTMLNYLVRRHEALRTTYHLDIDGDPRQRVHPPAALPLATATVEQDGTEPPATVVERLSTTDFDLATEWPIRACAVTRGGLATQVVLVLNHMAFDAWTFDRFERELLSLRAGFAARRPAALEPVRHQPLHLAQFESSAEAVGAKDRALAYWREEIARLPADTLGPRRRYDAEPTARGATLTSPAMLDASRRIARRHQVWPSLVHLATYTMLMAAYTGSDRVAHLSFTGNRTSTTYADVMTCMFSPLLMTVDCPWDAPFTEVLRRTAARFEQSQDHAYVPYDELVELVSRESFRRGQAVRTGSELNFVSQASVASRARRTRFTWNPAPTAWQQYGSDTYLRISELSDAVVLGLHAVSTVIDAEAMEQLLRGYETVLLAHDDPAEDLRVDEVAELVGFTAPAPGADGPGAIDLDEVAAVLRRHAAVRRVQLSTQDSDRLVARVETEAPVGPAQLRTHFLGYIYDHPVRCPDWFRVYHGADLVDEGDGRKAEPLAATSDAERSLATAVQGVNGLAEVSLSDSYTVAGGRVLRIPRVLETLREQGWAGVSVYQLAGGQPLRPLAQRLTRIAA